MFADIVPETPDQLSRLLIFCHGGLTVVVARPGSGITPVVAGPGQGSASKFGLQASNIPSQPPSPAQLFILSKHPRRPDLGGCIKLSWVKNTTNKLTWGVEN